MIGRDTLLISRRNGMISLINNLLAETKAFGAIIKVWLLTLVVLILCTCSGPKLMLGSQTIGKQTDYSLSFGKLARQIHDTMGCATLRTGDQGCISLHLERWSTWQPYQVTPGMVYFQSPVLMQRRCSQTRWFQFQLIIPSFSNPSRTEWTVQRPSLPTVSPLVNSPVENLPQPPTKPNRNYRDLTRPSIGRTPVITPTMGRNSNSSSTMNRVNGNVRTTSSTTGGLRKPHYD